MGNGMARIILLQFAAALIAALVALIASGTSSGISALFGGLCCAIPNAFFALRLLSSARKSDGNPMNFFVGEFIKIALTIALLGAVVMFYRDLNWLAFLAAFIVVMKSYLILLFRH
jgi:ATP synthase protein I